MAKLNDILVIECVGTEVVESAKEALARPNGERTEYNIDKAMYVCRRLLLAVESMEP
jgi:hypothetical protein